LPILPQQFRGSVEGNRFLSGKSQKKWGSVFSLLLAGPLNDYDINIGQNIRYFGTIKSRIPRRD
jgi:hypothetical protein